MKTKLLLLALCISTVMFAQTGEKVGRSDKAGINTEFKNNKFWDNWFISLGGGISSFYGAQTKSFEDQIQEYDYVGKLAVGKWINPMFGLRLQGAYGIVSDTKKADARYTNDFKYISGNLDAMLDLFNTFGRYNEKRVVSLIPYVGVGYFHGFDYGKYENSNTSKVKDITNASLSLHSGLMVNFRLSSALALGFDFSFNTLNGQWDNIPTIEDNYDYMYDATLNLTYKFKRRDFSVVEPMDYDLINSLNNEINSLRSQLNQRVTPKPEVVKEQPVIKTVTNYIPNVVYFKINSAVIREDQQISIRNVADFLKKESDVQVKVIGYADKKTGNPTYNNKLSERRARAVAKELTDKYGVSSSRISIEWKGDTEQPYDVNEWNRVVIFQAR